MKFYRNLLGLQVGFTINNDPKHPYLQLSRDTFLELAAAGGNQSPGFTHVHLVVDDLNATLARLKKSGMPVTPNTNEARTPGSVTVASFSVPSQVWPAYITDTDNMRIELNQWVDSLPKEQPKPGSSIFFKVIGGFHRWFRLHRRARWLEGTAQQRITTQLLSSLDAA